MRLTIVKALKSENFGTRYNLKNQKLYNWPLKIKMKLLQIKNLNKLDNKIIYFF